MPRTALSSLVSMFKIHNLTIINKKEQSGELINLIVISDLEKKILVSTIQYEVKRMLHEKEK